MKNTIILASNSPRRKDILTDLHIPFTVRPSPYEEIQPEGMKAGLIPEYFARMKVESLAATLPADTEEAWILGADTAIVFQETCIGKPKDRNEAYTFLKAFAGHTHQVVTGIALLHRTDGTLVSLTVPSDVTVKPMTEAEINWYLDTDEWQGVAGAYRIQESFSRFVSGINGSYSGIIGLPISELYDILKQLQYPVLDCLQ
ncbi:MAG: Maf family protein [Treponemataceae bacterium]|nr:Maf family protein [Treponemataceae bacterium]